MNAWDNFVVGGVSVHPLQQDGISAWWRSHPYASPMAGQSSLGGSEEDAQVRKWLVACVTDVMQELVVALFLSHPVDGYAVTLTCALGECATVNGTCG